MKTILVDAWNTFITENGMPQEMYTLLEKYPNTKIILTNANDKHLVTLGIVNMPYEVFTLKNNPAKINPAFYQTMLEKFGLNSNDVIYFEHNADAVKSAQSVGITTYHYDKDKKNLDALKKFLDENLS